MVKDKATTDLKMASLLALLEVKVVKDKATMELKMASLPQALLEVTVVRVNPTTDLKMAITANKTQQQV